MTSVFAFFLKKIAISYKKSQKLAQKQPISHRIFAIFGTIDQNSNSHEKHK